jgi:hypothetical protein
MSGIKTKRTSTEHSIILLRGQNRTAGNTGLAKVAGQCSVDTFVVNQSLVLRINICGENRHLRQARNR